MIWLSPLFELFWLQLTLLFGSFYIWLLHLILWFIFVLSFYLSFIFPTKYFLSHLVIISSLSWHRQSSKRIKKHLTRIYFLWSISTQQFSSQTNFTHSSSNKTQKAKTDFSFWVKAEDLKCKICSSYCHFGARQYLQICPNQKRRKK